MAKAALAGWGRTFFKQTAGGHGRRQARAVRGAPQLIEVLESRALLSAIGAENILVSSALQNSVGSVVKEYTRAGGLVQTFAVPWPTTTAVEPARDLAVGSNGRVHVYNGDSFNGDFAPFLSTLDPVTSTWTHSTFRSWSTRTDDGFGGIAVIGSRVFVSDTRTSSDSLGGIVRFVSQGGTTFNPARFASSEEYEDVNAGLDGYLYGLEAAVGPGAVVRRFDGGTGGELGEVALQTGEDVRGIAVDAAGDIFAVTWEGSLYKFDAAGNVLIRRDANAPEIPKNTTGVNNLIDVDVAADGTLVVGNRFGDVYLTDAALDVTQRISAGGGPVYVAFGAPAPAPPHGAVAGTVFSDRDSDGRRDAGEAGTPGVTVYLDLDRDGVFDAGELSAVTAADGSYRIEVPPGQAAPVGEYVVREIPPVGFRQTAPDSGTDMYYAGGGNRNFWKIDAATGVATYVGSTGGVMLHGLVRTNDGRLYAIQGFNNGDDEFYEVDPATGATTFIGNVGADLAWDLTYDDATDTIYGLGKVGASNYYQLGKFDRLTGAFRPVSGGPGASAGLLTSTGGMALDPVSRKIIVYEYADGAVWEFSLDGTARQISTIAAGLGSNLAYDGSRFVMRSASGRDVLQINPYAGTWSVVGTDTLSIGAQSLEFVKAHDRSHVITVVDGLTAGGLDFGNVSTAGEIRGAVWDDRNADGVRQADEAGRAGVTVYLDVNNNGVFDAQVPQTVAVDPDAYPYGTVLRDVVPGVTLTARDLQGNVFDTVKSLGQDATLGRLFGHRTAYGTEALFWGGSYPMLQADFAQPTDSVTVTFRAYSGSVLAKIEAFDAAGRAFTKAMGYVNSTDPLSLTINAPGIAYIRAGGDGNFVLIDRLEFHAAAAEPTAVTAADGSYSFTGLPSGTYFVGEVTPRGWARTSLGNERNVYYGTGYENATGGTMRLVTIDAVTGQVTVIGDPLAAPLYGLIRTNAGELYGTSYTDDRLYRVDPATGQMTLVGPIGWQITGGLAYDPNGDVIYTLGSETTASGTFMRLLSVDRNTGAATAIGPGVQTFPGSTVGPTGVSALAFDVLTNRVIAFDNGDGEFYAYDWAGNGTLLSKGPNVRTWSFSAGPNHSFILQPFGTGDGFLSVVNPSTAQLGPTTLTLSEVIRLESLDWNYDAWRYIVQVDGTAVDGVDFGIYDADYAPVADPGGAYDVREGDSLTLSGVGSSDLDDDPLTYEWDLGADGTIDATGVSPTFTWQQLVALGLADDGTYNLRLRVSDPAGNSSIDSTTIHVSNAAPVLTSLALDQATINEGGMVTLSGSFTDAGPLDTQVVTIDWGDGSPLTVIDPAANSFSRSHVYGDVSAFAPLQYVIRVTVRDDDGGSVTDSRTLQIARPAPAIIGVRYGYGNGLWADAADLAGRPAPWDITHFAVMFNHDVSVGLTQLSVTGTAGGVPINGLEYNVQTHVASWAIDGPLTGDRLRFALDGDDGAADGNDGVKSSAGYLAGGDASWLLDVLFGDVNGSGVVTSADWQRARALVGTSDPYADVNGSGIVTSADAQLVRNAVGGTLPAAGTGTGEGTGNGSGAAGPAAAVEESSPVVVCLGPAAALPVAPAIASSVVAPAPSPALPIASVPTIETAPAASSDLAPKTSPESAGPGVAFAASPGRPPVLAWASAEEIRLDFGLATQPLGSIAPEAKSDEPLDVFWSGTEKDDAFAGRLLAGV